MSQKRLDCRSACLLLVVAATSSGCSSKVPGRPETVPVQGEVWFHGQPVHGARVVFHCPGAPRAAIGETDDQGRFALGTFAENDGAPPGEHTVTIAAANAQAPVRSVTEAGYAQAQQAQKTASPPSSPLPVRYADVKTSELRATVSKAGPREFRFDLRD